jgi:hypothetical protein
MKIDSFRLRAFLIHLLASVFIAGISLLIVFVIWHPAPLAKAVGVTHIFIMMLTIDVILGPLLTLIVARKGKKSLKFDLGVIIVLQLAAFIYGIYNIASSRPVYIAFDTLRFEVVQANNVTKDSLKKASPPYKVLGWGQPEFVAVKPAENTEQKNNRLFLELETGVAPSMKPNLYEPLDNQWSIISKKAKPISQLYQTNNKPSVDIIINDYPSTTAWLPLVAYEQDMVVLIDTTHNEVVDIVDLRP